MEPLSKSLNDVRQRLAGLSPASRVTLVGGLIVLVVALAVAGLMGSGATYQYAFTNLSAEDSGEAAAQLKAAGIPFRVEAGGSALAVPASQVYDARLLLAASGLPRGGGVGFEIFDRGDLGVSEFTQRVNLRRAIEGELSRTVSRLNAVRSARVHITLPEKGLYRDEDRRASAAVVVSLQSGRALADRELQGIRHLVASAVPGLASDNVTVVDGHGAVLAGQEPDSARVSGAQREIERGLEGRVIELLEAAVGPGAVVAKVTASVDASEVESTQDVLDPDSQTVRSERKVNEQSTQDASGPAGVAGAAANQPMTAAATGGGGGRGLHTREDELKNYEISKTVTRTVSRAPRLKRLSVAVLVDGLDGKPRAAAELARLGELAKGAVGFDATRGDKLEISSAPFQKGKAVDADAALPLWEKPAVKYGALGLGALVVIIFLFGFLKILAKAAGSGRRQSLLPPGTSIAQAEVALGQLEAAARLPGMAAQLGPGAAGALPAIGQGAGAAPVDPGLVARERARAIAGGDPARAAMLLKAWIDADRAGKEAA
jgi:flagellar M-ring protein FliF